MLSRLAHPALPCHAHTHPFTRCTLAMQSEEPPNQQRRARPAADIARAAAASARESDEGSNAPGTAGASRSGAAADADEPSPSSSPPAAAGVGAGGAPAATHTPAAAAAGAAPAPAPAPAPIPPAAAAGGVVVTPGAHLLAESPAASENREAADIIAAGGPTRGWLSSERVHDLLAHFRQWRLPVSNELKQLPQGKSTSQCGNSVGTIAGMHCSAVGVVVIVCCTCIWRHADDGQC